MRGTALPGSLVLLIALSPAFTAAAINTEVIRKEFDAGRYPSALQLISRELSANQAPAGSAERYQLLMLRGECLLGLKSSAYARQAFEDAMQNAPQPEDRFAAAAMVALIKRSPGLSYAPKSDRNQDRISIVEPASRKKAMAALFVDMRADLEPRVAQAAQATTLPPIRALLPDLFELASLDRVLNGSLDQTKPLLVELGQRARQLLISELRRMRRQLEEGDGILYGMTVNNSGNIRPRTLGTEDRKQLEDIGSYVRQIGDAAMRGRKLAQALGDSGAPWESIIGDEQDLLERLDQILVRGQ